MPSSCDGGVVVSVASTIVVVVLPVAPMVVVVALPVDVVGLVLVGVVGAPEVVVGVGAIVVCARAGAASITRPPQAIVNAKAADRISGATAPLHRSGGRRRCRHVPEVTGDGELEEDVLELRAIADVVHDHVPVGSRRRRRDDQAGVC